MRQQADDMGRYINTATTLQPFLIQAIPIYDDDLSVLDMKLHKKIITKNYQLLYKKGDDKKGFAVYELEARSSNWLYNHTLSQLGLAQEGVLVLGIHRANGNYIGAPHGDTLIGCNDILTCYGSEKVLKRLSSRLSGAKGDAEHAAMVEDQMKVKEKESKI